MVTDHAEKLANMELLETAAISDKEDEVIIVALRVPGGWLMGNGEISPIFVPKPQGPVIDW